jgi:hypothetical protein
VIDTKNLVCTYNYNPDSSAFGVLGEIFAGLATPAILSS